MQSNAAAAAAVSSAQVFSHHLTTAAAATVSFQFPSLERKTNLIALNLNSLMNKYLLGMMKMMMIALLFTGVPSGLRGAKSSQLAPSWQLDPRALHRRTDIQTVAILRHQRCRMPPQVMTSSSQ